MKLKTEITNVEDTEIIIRCAQRTERIRQLESMLEAWLQQSSELILTLDDTEYYVPKKDILFFETENGKVISAADTKAVIGFAVPGLQNSLRLTDYEVTKDLDLPESIKIEADVTDFELGFTTTIISSGLFEDLKEEDLRKNTRNFFLRERISARSFRGLTEHQRP